MSAEISGARDEIGVCDAFGVSGKRRVMPRGAGLLPGPGPVTGRPWLRLVWSAPGQRRDGADGSPSAQDPHAGDEAKALPSSSAAFRAMALPGPAGLRLTRRGRAVLAAGMILAVLAIVTVLRTSPAGGSQASGRGATAGSPYSGMTQVVVRPGQTLWSVAAAAEPAASTWAVVQEIIEVNALSSPEVEAGQLLWVPRA
jgi:hypothetical protein